MADTQISLECVAQSNCKPLLPITCGKVFDPVLQGKTDRSQGDLGLTAREVESKLETSFQLAQAWDCILLLDEADIFLAARTATDLERNALVSGESLCVSVAMGGAKCDDSISPSSRIL